MATKTFLIIVVAIIAITALVAVFSISFPQTFSFGNKIAVVKVEGVISAGSSILPIAAADPETIKSLLKDANSDPTVRAILLEINSPGGSPVASDEISAAVENSSKTVVAYIAEQGTSGAYWVAASADKIVSHPLSLTCSIGAFTTINDLSGFYEKIGLNATTIKSGELKDIGTINRPPTEKEKELFQDLVDDVNSAFVEHVKETRNLTDLQLAKIGDGRPCLGKDALDYGLVDKLGTKEDAIKLIEELEGIKRANVVEFAKEESIFGGLFASGMAKGFYAIGMGLGDSLNLKNSISS